MSIESSLRTNVLLVDDQPSNLLALEAILEPLEQDLVAAHSGKEALKHLLTTDFSVILLDVQMPDLDGFETASLIKERAKSRHIPIIFLTAISKDDAYVARGYTVGAVDYLTKPFDPDVLRQKVSVFVDLFRKNEAIRQQAETMRQRREREVAEFQKASEQRYRDLAESMPQVVWTADPTGELTYGNRRWHESSDAVGTSEGKDGQNWNDVLHPDDRVMFQTTWADALEKGVDWEAQFRFASKERGPFRWHLVRAVAVRTSAGKVSSWIGTNTDINDRKRAEDALRILADASILLGGSLDYEKNLPDVAKRVVPTIADYCVVQLLDRLGNLRVVAAEHRDPERLKALLSIAGDARATVGPMQVLRSGAAQTHHRSGLAAIEDREAFLTKAHADVTERDKIRSLAASSYISVPIHARERIVGVLTLIMAESQRETDDADQRFAEDLARRVAAAIDVSELYAIAERERANLEQANRVKDEFLATLSHELRTPLNAVLGWTQLLQAGNLDEKGTARALDTVERNARSQAQLIADLLDVSRIVSGKLKLEMSRVPLRQVVDDAFLATRPAADTKGVKLVAVLDDASAPNQEIGDVTGDAERLKQITSNLLSNAIKFTPADGTVTVSLERVPGWARLTVSDTGQGITKEFLPFVFDRFRQADSTATRTQGGLGLGLSIVKHLVELHGGTVRVTSEGPGLGSSFIVEIPRVPKERTEQSPLLRAESPNGEWGKLGGVHILVVEDDPDGRELLKTVLERCGAEVTAVGAVPAALDAVRASWPDVVVSDIGLPGEDGYALATKLRAMSSERGQALPAIALTAYATERDRARALSAGFLAHSAKPVDPRELTLTVANVLRGAVSSGTFKAAPIVK